MHSAVTTLFENDYHHGTAALANSLVQNGFTGTIWAGYRGPLPAWAARGQREDGSVRIALREGAEMRLVAVDSPLHFAHYKPWFMLHVLEQLDPAADAVFYFDPDIVVPTRWSYYEEWVSYGVALAEDNHYHIGAQHPLRYAWKQFAQERGLTVHHELSRFCNSGFVGTQRAHASFLRTWCDLIRAVEPESGSLTGWRRLDRTHRFWSANQDTMNLAAMVTEHPVAIYGPNGMDFVPSAGRPIMSHAVDKPKPWRRSYLRDLLRGRAPSRPDRWFWRYVDGPLPVFTSRHARRQQTCIRLAAFLARFYHRPDV